MIQCARVTGLKEPVDGSVRSQCVLCHEAVWLTAIALLAPIRPVCDTCHPALPVTVSPE